MKALLSEFGIVGMGCVQLWLLRPTFQLAFNQMLFYIYAKYHIQNSHIGITTLLAPTEDRYTSVEKYSVPFEVVHLLEELFSHPWLSLQSPPFS